MKITIAEEDARKYLRSTGWLAATPDEFARRLVSAASVIHAPRGLSPQHVGDEPGGLWGIADGALALEVAPGRGAPEASFLLHAGAWCGEGGVIAGIPRIVGLKTTRRSVLLHMPHRRFFEIAREIPDAWRWVAGLSLGNTQRAIALADALMIRDSATRSATVIACLTGARGPGPVAPPPIELDLTQAELARIANVSRSVLNPTLRDLSARTLIETRRNMVVVRDLPGLETVAG